MHRRVVEKCHDVLREAYCGSTVGVDSLANRVYTNGGSVSRSCNASDLGRSVGT
jgi:hypothetical protein